MRSLEEIKNLLPKGLGNLQLRSFTPDQKREKVLYLRDQLAKYEQKLAYKMKFYRGVIHESASSELKHAEVTVLQAMVADLKKEIYGLEQQKENA